VLKIKAFILNLLIISDILKLNNIAMRKFINEKI